MSARSKLSYAPALLAMAVAQAAFGFSTALITAGADYSNQVLPNTPGTQTAVLPLNYGTANFFGVIGGPTANDFVFSASLSTGGKQVFYYSGYTGTALTINPAALLPDGITLSAYATTNTGNTPYATLIISPTTPITTGYNFNAQFLPANASPLGSAGSVFGQAARDFGVTATNSGSPIPSGTWGMDTWLYLPANTSGNTTATPTTIIINNQGVLADVNSTPGILDPGGKIYYSSPLTNTSVTQQNRTSMGVAVNSNNQVIGWVNRYTGTTVNSTILGQDAFIYTPGASTPVQIMGLTSNVNHNSFTVTGMLQYSYSSNAPLALSNTGYVEGMTTRYQALTGGTNSPAAGGNDLWLYVPPTSPATTGNTYQIGLVGTVATNNAATAGGYYGENLVSTKVNFMQEASATAGFGVSDGPNPLVAGSSVIYAVPSATSANTTTPAATTLGQEAWIYAPSSTPGTASMPSTGSIYGTTPVGTYTQFGVVTVGGPALPNVGYANSAGLRNSAITNLSTTGNAFGYSVRYLGTTSTTALGQDAVFYNSATQSQEIVTPGNEPFSNYISSTGVISVGNTAQPYKGFFLNNAPATSTAAIAAATIARFIPNSVTSAGSDVFAYSPLAHTSYIIVSPAIMAAFPAFSAFNTALATNTNSQGFSASVLGVTDAGMVYGLFSPFTGVGITGSSTSMGTYVYAWTQATGTLLLSASNSLATVDGLSTPVWTSGLLTSSLFVDASGDVFGEAAQANNSGRFGVFELLSPVAAGSGLWDNALFNGGKWSTNGNWKTAFPNGVGFVATFDDTAVGGAGTVDLNSNMTVGGINLNTASAGYTIGVAATANTLTFQASSGNAAINVTGAGSHTINALSNLVSTTDVSVAPGASLNMVGTVSGAGALTLTGGGVLKLSAAAGNTYAGTTVNGGTLIVSNTSNSATGSANVTLNAGTLGGTGTIAGTVLAGTGAHTIAPSAALATGIISTLTVGGLTTNTNTTLAINLNGPGASDQIVTGASGLTLNGGTLAVNNSATNVGLPSLGYSKLIAYSGTIGGTGYTSIALPGLSAGLIQYTLDVAHDANFVDLHRGFSGDANDDGLVNFADFVLLSNNFGLPNEGWAGGDFNGDGITNFADFVLLSNNFGQTVDGAAELSSAEVAAFHTETASFGGGPSSVPEPASLALMGLGAAVLLKRRRKA